MTTLLAPATVTLSLGGTATRAADADTPNDYQVSENLTITISMGSPTGTTQSLQITPTADSVFEGDETITISGTTVSLIGGVMRNLVTDSDAAITIVDDDFDITLTVTAPEGGMISESSDTTSVTVQAAFDTDRVQVRGTPVNVALNVATDARYRVIEHGTIEISAGEADGTGTVKIAPVNDGSWSPDKTINITGTSDGTYSIRSTSVTLTDDDTRPLAARLTVDDSELTENGGAQQVTVTAALIGSGSFADERMVALTFDPEGTDATYKVAEDDPKVAIPAGMSSGSMVITIEPTNNEVFNDDIVITIDGSIGSDLAATAVEQVVVTIRNEDFDGVLTVSPMELSETDDETEVTVTATLPRMTQDAPRTVSLTLGGEAETDGSDYDAASDNPGTIEFDAGENTKSVTLKLNPDDDGLLEGDETIVISGAITGTNIRLKSATIILRDEQRAMITLTTDVDELLESGGESVTVTVKATQSSKIVVPTVVTLAKGGSAIKGVDYEVSGDGTITIVAGTTENTTELTFTPVDDLMFENLDGETIVISGTTPEDNVVHPVTIALIDNNMIPLASFTVDPVEINEGDGDTEVTITAILGGTSGEEIEIGLAKPGTAIKDEDFMVTEAEDAPAFVIAVGDTMMSKTVTITPVDDMLYEGDEIINVTGTTMIDMEAYGDAMVADITLVDNDPAPTISLAVDVDTIAEDGGPQDVTITATATSASAVDIPITLSKPGTAVVGEDFTVASEQEDFTIVAGDLTATKVVTITPIDDDIYEGDEHIMVSGTVPDPEGEADVEGAMITLTDDEMMPTVALSVDPISISEDGGDQEVTITATASGASSMDMVIELDKSGGTAQPGTDFGVTAPEGDFTIAAGETSAMKTVTLTPVNDDIYEGDEEIMVGGMIGETAVESASITLTDDEMMPMVVLTSDVDTITENGEAVSVTVTAMLSGLSSMPITVELAKSGSAVKGEDYSVTGEGTITVDAGEESGATVLMIAPVDDQVYEGNEMIVIGGTAGEEVADAASITLVDDESVPTVTLSIEPGMMTEGEEQEFTITATTEPMSSMPITIELDKSAGTAQPGADFELTGATEGPFMIAALTESSTKMVTLMAIDDDLYEGEEEIAVGGSASVGDDAVAAGFVATSITLNDAQTMPTFTLAADPASVNENAGPTPVLVTATASGRSSMNMTLAIVPVLEQSTITIGEDAGVTGDLSITVAAGSLEGSTTITAVVIDDDIYEGDEYVVIVGRIGDMVTPPITADHHRRRSAADGYAVTGSRGSGRGWRSAAVHRIG